MHKLKNLKAFTLAEALIALTIIAIIAALCVPVMKRDNFRAQVETGVKKGYYSLNASMDRAIVNDFKFTDWIVGNVFTQKMRPELNVAKKCNGAGDCFGGTGITIANSVMLADGISIGSNGAILYVDGNGLDEPNELGVDIYKFTIKKIVDEEDNKIITFKIEPDDASAGAGKESAANLVKNGWKITAW